MAVDLDMERPASVWRIDKTVNIPILMAIGATAVTVITWGNGVTSAIDREREARVKLEQVQQQQRVEAGQLRAELMQQQSQVRVELQQQLGDIKSEIKTELRELRNDIKANR
jgi:hypothetical protein